MNFHQLHIFYTVAQKGNFSAAAYSLHMTQPAVTMQIQTLEEHIGSQLFIRTTKKVSLTEAGQVLLPYAKRSIDLMKETDNAMAHYTNRLKGRLDLGASLTIGEYILPPLLKSFYEQHGHISVGMKVMNTAQIVEDILNYKLNFGLVEAPIDNPQLHTEAVLRDELMLVMPKNHPLAKKEQICIQDVLDYPFILREQGSGTRRIMEDEFRKHHINLEQIHIAMELGSTGAVKSAVESGLGIAILSDSSVKHEVELGILQTRRIEGCSFTRRFFAIYIDASMLPIEALTFLTFIRKA